MDPQVWPLGLSPVGEKMKKLLAPILAATLALSAPVAIAGGPVIVDDTVEVVADQPASSVGVLPVILVAVVLCAALCGSGDSEPTKCSAAAAC